MLQRRWLGLITFVVLALNGCGGGGSGDSGGGTGGGPTTYSVGGSASGLSGTVVLLLNGANNLSVNAAGSFTFATTLATGSTYSVTVGAQPGTQVCNVTAGGSGTIASANVGNVTVTCANYSIGGAVTGLTQSGLVLQLNAGSDLSIPASSSSFVFPSSSSLGGGVTYNVRIKTQPAGQTCTIVKSTGFVNVAVPTVTGVNAPTVACIDNVSDAFSGTYQVQSDDSTARAFVAFYPEGTFIFGVHSDDPNCGSSHGNGVQYGVYNWNQASQTIRIVTHALDTADNCGLDVGTSATVTKHTDGTLGLIIVDSGGPHEAGTLTPVQSTTGTLIGSWGTNQTFTVYASNGTLFSADTRALSQGTATSPGIEDGCYALSGTTAAGSYAVNLTNSCSVSATQTGIDTSHFFPFTVFGSNPWNFTVAGDSMQTTIPTAGLTAPFTSTRIAATSLPSTYSITATISGLAASGLVLQNNGGNGAAVTSSATSSTVAMGIESRRAYAVTIRSQPTGQYCTVANGTGIVFANVSNVAVTCTTITSTSYSVSGTITGLNGTGLALRLNGQTGAAFNVTPTSGTTSFTFAAPLQTGNTYSVSVPAQPTGPTQICFPSSNQSGTVTTSNVTVVINCVNSVPYRVSGVVNGLTAAGLALRLSYTDTFSGATSTTANLGVVANSTGFSFADTIPANGIFDIGIVTQPAGQTCTIIRGRGGAIANFTNVGVACVNNTTDPLSGTYSFLDSQGRGYVNFNANGTFTTALIHNDWPCNTGNDMRNGNGVEYGVFSWTQSTGAIRLTAPAVIDTNGSCGFNDPGAFPAGFGGTITRVGNAIELRETSGGPIIATATAVESTPSSLVGAFVREAGNGELLVFHADGTFLLVDTQLPALFPLAYGQERGCYTVSTSTLILTIDANCRPDGFAAYDLNGPGGLVNASAGVMTSRPISFTINDANTLMINNIVFKRTQPN